MCNATNVNTISVIIREDRHLSLCKLEDLTNISRSSRHWILHDQLKMWCISSTWVPHFLTTDQMNARIAICKKWLSRIDLDPDVLMRIITGDESWISHFEPLLKHESATWKSPSSPHKKKVRQQQSVFKIMLTVFLDSSGPLYQHILSTNTTINSASYCKVLRTLCYCVGQKRPHLRDQKMLHHDTAQPHTSNATQDFLDSEFIGIFGNSSYSPDLAPNDFWLFPYLKKELQGKQYQTHWELESAINVRINTIPADKFWKMLCVKWLERMRRCIATNSRYFEKEPTITDANLTDNDEDEDNV